MAVATEIEQQQRARGVYTWDSESDPVLIEMKCPEFPLIIETGDCTLQVWIEDGKLRVYPDAGELRIETNGGGILVESA